WGLTGPQPPGKGLPPSAARLPGLLSPAFKSGFQYVILDTITSYPLQGGFHAMADIQAGQWPKYTYIVPQIYTKAKVRLIGLGNYAPAGMITNEFFAYISTRLGDPRTAED